MSDETTATLAPEDFFDDVEQPDTSPDSPDTHEGLTPYADLAPEQATGLTTFDAEKRRELAALAHRDTLSTILKSRRLDLLPPIGPGAPVTKAQGREPGDSTTPAELSDLIASIATMGVLQPILVEERPQPSGDTLRVVVAGERRLRAVRWGHVHLSDNPHFQQIPAVLVPGPLSDEDARSWQLIENLAREDLKPGELAAALLFERCAILVTKLLSHGIPVPRDVLALDNPLERFEALEKLRGKNAAAAAPWEEVLHRLGLQMTARKARQLIAAFKALPRHVSEEMDEERIALSTRIRFADLRKGREAAADEIWAAVKARKQAKALLNGAVTIAAEAPDLPVNDVVDRAQLAVMNANQARREALAVDPTLYGAPPRGETWEAAATHQEPITDQPVSASADQQGRDDVSTEVLTPAGAAPGQTFEPLPTPDPADPDKVKTALDGLRDLVAHLLDGHAPSKYDAGSLALQARRLLDALNNPVAPNRPAPQAREYED
jgi:ParB family chromosome partitioning protein